MNERAARARRTGRSHSRPRRRIRATDPDGTIRIISPAPLGAYDPSLARLFRAAVEAQPARIFLPKRSRRRLAQAYLRAGAPHGRCARRRAARARPLGRAPGDDPLGQRDRPRAADARRLHGGRSGRADFGRLFAAEPGLRQAQAHRRAAHARPDLCRRHRAIRQGARRDRRRRRDRREPRRRQPRRDAVRRPRAHASRARRWTRPPPRAAPTRSRKSCSPPARPACPRA